MLYFIIKHCFYFINIEYFKFKIELLNVFILFSGGPSDTETLVRACADELNDLDDNDFFFTTSNTTSSPSILTSTTSPSTSTHPNLHPSVSTHATTYHRQFNGYNITMQEIHKDENEDQKNSEKQEPQFENKTHHPRGGFVEVCITFYINLYFLYEFILFKLAEL